MYLGLPEDVNLSPASLRPDLWLCEVSAESWAKQQGQSRHTLPAGELNQMFSFFQKHLNWLFFAFFPFPAVFASGCWNAVLCSFTTDVTSILLQDPKPWFFQTDLITMETEQSAGSCPAPGQAAVRTWLPSSTRGTSTWLLLTLFFLVESCTLEISPPCF